MYHDLKWTESEKKQARKTFEFALQVELNETLLDFKRRAAAVEDADQMWAVGCRRRLNFDPPCRLNFDPGMGMPATLLPAVDNCSSYLLSSA
jgi:hypothetical protein